MGTRFILNKFQNIDNDVTEARRKIKEDGENKLHMKLSVFCGTGQFSYSAYTESHCQVRKGDMTCYAFKMPI